MGELSEACEPFIDRIIFWFARSDDLFRNDAPHGNSVANASPHFRRRPTLEGSRIDVLAISHGDNWTNMLLSYSINVCVHGHKASEWVVEGDDYVTGFPTVFSKDGSLAVVDGGNGGTGRREESGMERPFKFRTIVFILICHI
jgi:hypothetical protein